MSNKNRELIEKYFKEMYDLDIERKVYKDLHIKAIGKRAECVINGDNAGAMAWDSIKQDCVDAKILITERIKDLYKECVRLKALGET